MKMRIACFNSTVLAGLMAMTAATGAMAGGGPENVLLLVDPNVADSLEVANHYQAVRGVPDRNVIYLAPTPDSFQEFADFHRHAVPGMIEQRGVADHIDYIVIPPGGNFFVGGSGLVDDAGCQQGGFGRFSASSVYTTTFITDAILGGGLSVLEPNRYHSASDQPVVFDSNITWSQGQPDDVLSARRYFIGFMLGYSGARGNTIDEIIEMIDRSVAADGTRPVGTFYFMETDDAFRSPPRDPLFENTINSMLGIGAQAEEILADLPISETDCLGILTGEDVLPIEGGNFEILPGAFCDHLTSFAGTFDTNSQTKMSEWIRKGASGTMGTVEEPCVFGLPEGGIPGKFPHPQLHNWYFWGLSLGEALFRSIQWTPFECLFYGDPLTQPFARFPVVSVPDAPVGPVAGLLTLSPVATTDSPGVGIERVGLFVDGKMLQSQPSGTAFTVDTGLLDDGWHEVRIVATDDSAVGTQGRWVGEMVVDNRGLSASITSGVSVGGPETVFAIDVSASGGVVSSIELMHNRRVLAAVEANTGSFPIAASILGQGSTRLFAVANFENGGRAVSEPLVLQTKKTVSSLRLAQGNSTPQSYSYTADVLPGQAVLIDLPALDADGDGLEINVLSSPTQATVELGFGAHLLRIDEDAVGGDTLTFETTDGSSTSNVGTVTLRYCTAPVILEQPTDQEACAGSDATLAVQSEPGVTFQWFRGDAPIPGATGSDLTIEDVSDGDAGFYSVEMTRRCGDVQASLRSQSVFLNVPAPVAITSDPVGDELCAGDDWTVFVSASSASDFQWFRNGQPLEGETNFFLFLTDVGIADGGIYTVRASNGCGFVESEPAQLVVAGCGDGDFDNDVDLTDFGRLQLCRTPEPSLGLPIGCDPFDFDADLDIDLFDYDRFVDLVTGP